MTIAAGKLRHRIMFQQQVRVQDRMGGYVEVWQDAFEIWASVKPQTTAGGAREIVRGEVMRDERAFELLVRFYSGITTTMRVRFGERLLHIRGIRNIDERNEVLELYCVEGG